MDGLRRPTVLATLHFSPFPARMEGFHFPRVVARHTGSASRKKKGRQPAKGWARSDARRRNRALCTADAWQYFEHRRLSLSLSLCLYVCIYIYINTYTLPQPLKALRPRAQNPIRINSPFAASSQEPLRLAAKLASKLKFRQETSPPLRRPTDELNFHEKCPKTSRPSTRPTTTAETELDNSQESQNELNFQEKCPKTSRLSTRPTTTATTKLDSKNNNRAAESSK